MKSKSTAYILWFFLGFFGAHKFYLGKIGMGILYFFTLGLFGVGWLIDAFTLSSQVDLYNALFGRIFGAGMNNNNANNIVVNVPGYAARNPADISDQLHRLDELKTKGLLTDQEHAAQKAKLLASS
jgi:TM2 domain-containing membrane protein YozV